VTVTVALPLKTKIEWRRVISAAFQIVGGAPSKRDKAKLPKAQSTVN
jgi:hypothetical protein